MAADMAMFCRLLCVLSATSFLVPWCRAFIDIRVFKSDQSNEATLFTSVTSVSCSSKLHCASLCSQRSDCLTFRFSPDTSMCQMSNEEPGGFGSGIAVFTYGLRSRSDLTQCKRLVSSVDGQLSCTIQQRVSGSVSFQQSWSSYETGFGDASNFWIGLQNIHRLSSPPGVTFLVDMITWSNATLHQEYPQFCVQNNSAKYKMTVGPPIAGKSSFSAHQLGFNTGNKFSTLDSDNDDFSASCSVVWHGSSGWWFGSCTFVNPNGIYVPSAQIDSSYMSWMHDGSWVSLKAVRLMLAV